MNDQDPQTVIDHDLYPSSARPSGLEVPREKDNRGVQIERLTVERDQLARDNAKSRKECAELLVENLALKQQVKSLEQRLAQYVSQSVPEAAKFHEAMERERGSEWKKELNELAHYLEAIGPNSVHYEGEIEMFKRAARELRYTATPKANFVPAELKIAELEKQCAAMREQLSGVLECILTDNTGALNPDAIQAVIATTAGDYFKVCPKCNHEVGK